MYFLLARALAMDLPATLNSNSLINPFAAIPFFEACPNRGSKYILESKFVNNFLLHF